MNTSAPARRVRRSCVLRPGMRERELADVGALLGRQLPVHEHVESVARHSDRAVQEHEHDDQAEQRIDHRPAGRLRSGPAPRSRPGSWAIAAVVHAVRLDGDRAGAADHKALEYEQHGRSVGPRAEHRDAETRVCAIGCGLIRRRTASLARNSAEPRSVGVPALKDDLLGAEPVSARTSPAPA